MHFFAAALAAVLVLLPAGASAQTRGHGHPHHGGQTRMIGPYEAELVVKGSDVTLLLATETEEKVDASRLSGTAEVLTQGNERRSIELKPGGDNKLAGKAEFPVGGKFRATVTLRDAQGGQIGKGRYSLDVLR